MPAHRPGLDFLQGEGGPALGGGGRQEGFGADGLEVPIGVLESQGAAVTATPGLDQLETGLEEIIEEESPLFVALELHVLIVGETETDLESLETREGLVDLALYVETPLLHVDPHRYAFFVLVLLVLVFLVLVFFVSFFSVLRVLQAARQAVFGVETAHRNAEKTLVCEEVGGTGTGAASLEVGVGHDAEGSLFFMLVFLVLVFLVLVLFVLVSLETGEAGDLVIVGLPGARSHVPGPVARAAVDLE